MEIPQTTQRSSMKLQNVLEMVCATCLSHDRRLYTMREYPDLRYICSYLTLESNVSICWECKAVLSRVKQFTAQAVRAKAVLDDIVENMKNPEDYHESLTSMSSLRTQFNTDFYTFTYEEVKLQNVKTEKEEFIEVTILPENIKQEELAVESEMINDDYKYDMDDDYLDVGDESLSYFESEDDEKSLNSKKANERSFHRSKDVTFGVETEIVVKMLSEEQMLEFREKTRNTRSTQPSSQRSKNIIIETGHRDPSNTRHTINFKRNNNNKKEYQKRYREQNREILKQREKERRKRIQNSQSIALPSTSSNTNRIELNNKETTAQRSFGLEKTQLKLRQQRLRQQRYREKNRDKLRQLELERRRRLRNAEMNTELSTSPIEFTEIMIQ